MSRPLKQGNRRDPPSIRLPEPLGFSAVPLPPIGLTNISLPRIIRSSTCASIYETGNYPMIILRAYHRPWTTMRRQASPQQHEAGA